MKTNLPILIGGAVIVVAVAAFFLLRGGEATTESAVSAPVPVLATTLAPNMAIITAGSSEPRPIASTTLAYAGDTLATSQKGRGLLQMENGTATVLDYDTKLTLEENDGAGTRTSGLLGAGAMWARVEKVFGKGEYYKIKTQNAVAVVRGTSFGLSYRGGVSKLLVATGTVSFMPVDPATGEALEDEEVLVTGGNKATVDASGTVRVSALTAEDIWSVWYLYNTNGAPKDKAPTVSEPTSQTPQTAPQSAPGTNPASSGNAPAPSGSTATTGNTGNTASGENACASFLESGGLADVDTKGSLKITSVSPVSVSKSGQETVTLTGEGFKCATTVEIGGEVLNGESGFVVVSNSSITFSSSVLPIGTFDISMSDSFKNTATLREAITITR